MIGDYSVGGYKIVDIETKFYALKFIWIKNLLDDDFHPLKSIVNHLHQSLGGVSVFHSNIQLSASCSATISGLSIFYQELIELWHKIYDTEPTQPSAILGQSVWNNRFILCKRDTIFCNEFYSNGIRTVYDLMCQDHKFLDWHAPQQKYGLAGKEVIDWFGIIKVLPNIWKKVVKNEVVDLQVEMPSACHIKIRGSLTSVCKISVKTVYDLLLEPICYCIYTQKLWKSLQRWLRASVVLPALTAEAALIGKWDAEHNNNLLANHVTLLFKRFFYINRTTSTKLNLYSLKLYLGYTEIIEKRIAKEKGSLECHFKKWNPILLLL